MWQKYVINDHFKMTYSLRLTRPLLKSPEPTISKHQFKTD